MTKVRGEKITQSDPSCTRVVLMSTTSSTLPARRDVLFTNERRGPRRTCLPNARFVPIRATANGNRFPPRQAAAPPRRAARAVIRDYCYNVVVPCYYNYYCYEPFGRGETRTRNVFVFRRRSTIVIRRLFRT